MEGKCLRSGGNVKAILKQFAIENKINELLLDYRVESFETFLQNDATGAKTPIQNSEINTYIESSGTIIQEYTIEIFRRKTSFYPIVIQIQSNDTNTELRALVFTQRIPQVENLELLIKSTIYNICAYRGIIIGLGWNNINPEIMDIASKLRNNDTHPEYYTIHICALKEALINSMAVRSIISKSATMSVLSHDSLLLSGGFFKVKKDEVLLAYKKPVYDSTWRNIFGQIYGIGTNYPIGIGAGAGIEVAQENDQILYIAAQDGYVSIVGNDMMISQTITLGGIDAKNITNIKEQEIESLVVKNDNLTSDVVSSGVELNIKNLKITGNVGAVRINSESLLINGQVHMKSDIVAKKASILHFKGKLKAKAAEIRYCENGLIECDALSINHISGSKVYTSKAKIADLRSNNIIFVQDSLQVTSMQGKNNEFILHPCIYGARKEMMDNLREKLQSFRQTIDIFEAYGRELMAQKMDADFLFDALNKKDASTFEGYNWDVNVLDQAALKRNSIQTLTHKYNGLMENLRKKSDLISYTIKQELSKMFQIEIVFENKCEVDFYVRFVNLFGSESRHLLRANKNNAIRKIMLAKNQDAVKIMCYKE